MALQRLHRMGYGATGAVSDEIYHHTSIRQYHGPAPSRSPYAFDGRYITRYILYQHHNTCVYRSPGAGRCSGARLEVFT